MWWSPDASREPDHPDQGDQGAPAEGKEDEDVTPGRLFFIFHGAAGSDRARGAEAPTERGGPEPDEAAAQGAESTRGAAPPAGVVDVVGSPDQGPERGI